MQPTAISSWLLALTMTLGVCWEPLAAQTSPGPYVAGRFKGRIAYSADGNNRDRDDLFASAVTIAMFKAFGVTDKVVHFDYNSILGEDNPEYLKVHEESVRGAARRFGLPEKVIFNDSRELDASIKNIRDAVNASSADDPLYFVIAGPMEVPWRGIQAAEAEKRKHVYCISHSAWNDVFFWDTGNQQLTHHRRDLIDLGIHWVQILSQRELGTCPEPKNGPCPQEKWALWSWMRDSQNPNVAWLYDRLEAMGRPDCSDSGMVYFLLTGNERASVQDLNDLLHGRVQKPLSQRSSIRLEAENFQLENYTVPLRRMGSAVSQRMAAQLEDGKREGTLRTVFHQPYAGGGQYDVDVRFFAAPQAPSTLTLLVNGTVQGEPRVVPAGYHGWNTWKVRDVSLKLGDEIAVKVKVDGDQTGSLDYVELDWRADQKAPAAVGPPSGGQAKLDDPAALPGQIIVQGSKPGYLKYNGLGPVFLCGPDNPEEFLFLGTLNADGTRSGGRQEQLIDTIAAAGVNIMHCQMFRMRSCNIKDEGDDQHCPFVGFDPARPLNEKVLDQWDGWLKKLEERGINVHFEFYNDATDVERMGWKLDAAGNLHPDEARFFTGIVSRFKHRKNILWGIEESLNKLPRARTPHFKKLSALVAQLDDHHHPIIHSFVTPETSERDFGGDNITSDEYIDDPNIHITSWLHVLPHGTDYEAQHQAYLKYAAMNRDRFIVMKSETERFPRVREQSRRYLWACAMTGMHTPEAGHNVLNRPALLPDGGRVRKFMEQTDFYTLRPADHLAAGSTKWVLADPGRSYIAYTYDCSSPMGIRDLPAGAYDLTWFDTVSGRSESQTKVRVEGSEATWDKPRALGNEIALHLRRSTNAP
jgi:hypothetical protein